MKSNGPELPKFPNLSAIIEAVPPKNEISLGICVTIAAIGLLSKPELLDLPQLVLLKTYLELMGDLYPKNLLLAATSATGVFMVGHGLKRFKNSDEYVQYKAFADQTKTKIKSFFKRVKK